MSRFEKLIAGIFVLGLVVFLGMSLSIYELRLDNGRLQDDIADLHGSVYNNMLLHEMDRAIAVEMEVDIVKNSEKISILDESVDAKNKKRAKIKKIRDTVRKYNAIHLDIQEFTSLAGAVIDYSEEYEVPISLVLSTIKNESAFDVRAKSHVGALGLMQIMPPTGQDISSEINKKRYNLYRIRDNIQFGTWYLWKMIDRFDGDLGLAVRAYNCGPHYVEKVVAGRYKDYPDETKDYVIKILDWKKKYEEEGL